MQHFWAPNFVFPSIDTVLRSVKLNLWMGDSDSGEHFLNFPLYVSLRQYAGVDSSTMTNGNNELVKLKDDPLSPQVTKEISQLQSLLHNKGYKRGGAAALWGPRFLPFTQ